MVKENAFVTKMYFETYHGDSITITSSLLDVLNKLCGNIIDFFKFSSINILRSKEEITIKKEDLIFIHKRSFLPPLILRSPRYNKQDLIQRDLVSQRLTRDFKKKELGQNVDELRVSFDALSYMILIIDNFLTDIVRLYGYYRLLDQNTLKSLSKEFENIINKEYENYGEIEATNIIKLKGGRLLSKKFQINSFNLSNKKKRKKIESIVEDMMENRYESRDLIKGILKRRLENDPDFLYGFFETELDREDFDKMLKMTSLESSEVEHLSDSEFEIYEEAQTLIDRSFEEIIENWAEWEDFGYECLKDYLESRTFNELKEEFPAYF